MLRIELGGPRPGLSTLLEILLAQPQRVEG
jgi:hypothetical protein